MPYTFLNLKDEIKALIWPNGVPENHVGVVDAYFVQAMNFIQQNVDCLRDEHVDITPQCGTYFRCGTSAMDRPDGVIKRLFTVLDENHCDPVTYRQVEMDELKCWSRCFARLVTAPANTGMEALPFGFKFPDASTDSEWGRAMVGLWAIEGEKIFIAPWLQTNERVVVEWSGSKTTWADTDLVQESADIKRAVKLFVQKEYIRDMDCDQVRYQTFHAEFFGSAGIIGALPHLRWECREKIKLRSRPYCPDEARILEFNYVKPTTLSKDLDPTPVVVLGLIGDYGFAGTPALDVATLVKSWEPDHIITLGGNNYGDLTHGFGHADTIDQNVGQHYHDYIFPYNGSYGIERSPNRFWPILGAADLDSDEGQPFLDYFSLPNNDRYYDRIFGNVHVFFINAGYQTDGTLVEVNGNSESSIQAQWILSRAIRSTARWKIAVVSHPPFTSRDAAIGFGGYPGNTALQWDFESYGFNAVFSGHGQHYERILLDGFPYFINGAGGHALQDFNDPPAAGSDLRYNDDYGAIRLSATCYTLLVQFVNRAGTVIDSYEIAHPASTGESGTVAVCGSTSAPAGLELYFSTTTDGDPNGVLDGQMGRHAYDPTEFRDWIKNSPLGTLTGWL